ncbi:hypothetical protein BGZ82_002187 [Podila clonocystis]|nr:hypothetical protein BGZ82_002187 [Podila clonocystis]
MKISNTCDLMAVEPLQILVLSLHAFRLSELGLVYIFQNCPRLTELKLYGVTRVRDSTSPLSTLSMFPQTRKLVLNTSSTTDAAELALIQEGSLFPVNPNYTLPALPRLTTLTQYQHGVPILQDLQGLPGVTHFKLLEAHGKQIKNFAMTYQTDTPAKFLPTIQGVRYQLIGALHQKQVETTFYSVTMRRKYLDTP